MSGCDCVRCQTEECDASELCSCCLNAEVERLREVLRSTQDLYHEAMEASRRYRGERDIARLDADKANAAFQRVQSVRDRWNADIVATLGRPLPGGVLSISLQSAEYQLGRALNGGDDD